MSTVTVCCRLPNGLNLDLIEYNDGGQSELKQRVTVNGSNNTTKFIDSKGSAIVSHGETQVEESFWTQWLERNANSPLVKNAVIFAKAKAADAKAMMKELAGEKVGFERLTPKDMPKGMTERKPNDIADE
jgi:hypothetical protein